MNRASIFMAATWTGLSGLLLIGGGQATTAPEVTNILGGLLLIASSIALMLTRRADEYTLSLWNAGASVAFGALLIMFLILPAAEGFLDGLMDAERQLDTPADVSIMLGIGAFYIGLFVKRLLGVG